MSYIGTLNTLVSYGRVIVSSHGVSSATGFGEKSGTPRFMYQAHDEHMQSTVRIMATRDTVFFMETVYTRIYRTESHGSVRECLR